MASDDLVAGNFWAGEHHAIIDEGSTRCPSLLGRPRNRMLRVGSLVDTTEGPENVYPEFNYDDLCMKPSMSLSPLSVKTSYLFSRKFVDLE